MVSYMAHRRYRHGAYGQRARGGVAIRSIATYQERYGYAIGVVVYGVMLALGERYRM